MTGTEIPNTRYNAWMSQDFPPVHKAVGLSAAATVRALSEPEVASICLVEELQLSWFLIPYMFNTLQTAKAQHSADQCP